MNEIDGVISPPLLGFPKGFWCYGNAVEEWSNFNNILVQLDSNIGPRELVTLEV